jgi:hypothetical protein
MDFLFVCGNCVLHCYPAGRKAVMRIIIDCYVEGRGSHVTLSTGGVGEVQYHQHLIVAAHAASRDVILLHTGFCWQKEV